VLRTRGLGAAPGAATDPLLTELSAYYFGETTDGASTRRFEAAVEAAWTLASS
jgi:hypothetical protein